MKVIFVTSQVITRHATMKRAMGMAGPLMELGWDVEVLAEDHPDNRAYFSRLNRVRGVYFPRQNALGEREWKNEYLRRSPGPGIVHVCGLGWRNAVRRAPEALTLMDHVELESTLAGTPYLRRTAQRFLEHWARRYYRGSVAASLYLYKWLRVRSENAVQHLPYGADGMPAPRPEDRRELKERDGLDRYALYCGGMHRNYAFWTMIDSCVQLCRERADFQAVLVGAGPELAAGQAHVFQLGLAHRIRLPGYVPEPEMMRYIACAELQLSPLNNTETDWARCPSKIPLYMMSRRPIVTCRVGEAIEYLGDLGWYYEPGSVESLSRMMDAVWSQRPGPVPYRLDDVSWSVLAERYAGFWSEHRKEREKAA